MFQVETPPPQISAEQLFTLGNFPVTNAMMSAILFSILVIVFLVIVAPKLKGSHVVPSKTQTVLEMIVEMFLNFVAQVTGSKKVALQILPLIGTIFIYIGISNILTLFPPLAAFNYEGIALFRTHTNDFSTTFGIAVGVVVATHILSAQKFGIIGHIDKFFPIVSFFKTLFTKPKEAPMMLIDFFIGVLDIVGEVGKSLSLSLRLFGNMFAGELLMTVFLSLFAILVPALWTVMSLFSGVIQAVVFGALAASYCASALSED